MTSPSTSLRAAETDESEFPWHCGATRLTRNPRSLARRGLATGFDGVGSSMAGPDGIGNLLDGERQVRILASTAKYR